MTISSCTLGALGAAIVITASTPVAVADTVRYEELPGDPYHYNLWFYAAPALNAGIGDGAGAAVETLVRWEPQHRLRVRGHAVMPLLGGREATTFRIDLGGTLHWSDRIDRIKGEVALDSDIAGSGARRERVMIAPMGIRAMRGLRFGGIVRKGAKALDAAEIAYTTTAVYVGLSRGAVNNNHFHVEGHGTRGATLAMDFYADLILGQVSVAETDSAGNPVAMDNERPLGIRAGWNAQWGRAPGMGFSVEVGGIPGLAKETDFFVTASMGLVFGAAL